MSASADEKSEGMKKCPDCAEWVRDEALKCRYCGYRFDLGRNSGESPSNGAKLFGSLVDVFRRPRGPEAPFDLLAGWGVELAPGESARFWVSGHVSSRQGYLIVTEERFMFFELSDRHSYRKVAEHPLSSVHSVTVESELSTRRLCLEGEGYELKVRGLKSTDAERVRQHIELTRLS